MKNATAISLAAAMALAAFITTESTAQELLPPGFTQESFELLKRRAEGGDAKAQELYRKAIASIKALNDAADDAAANSAANAAAMLETEAMPKPDAPAAGSPVAEEAPAKTQGALSGLFGKEFGATMPEGMRCETNNLFSLAYEYVPDKTFNEFTQYLALASPRTRTIYQIRGVHFCESSDEAAAKIKEVSKLLEMKFNRRLQKNGNNLVMRFPGGDRIEVESTKTGNGYAVIIDAVCDRFDRQDTDEALALKDEIAKSLVAALGKPLAEVLPPAAVHRTNENGEYLMPPPGVLKSMGFSVCSVALLPHAKRTGVLRAKCVEKGDSAKVLGRAKSQLQLLFGTVVDDAPGGLVTFTTAISDSTYHFSLKADDDGASLVIEDVAALRSDAEMEAGSDLDAL